MAKSQVNKKGEQKKYILLGGLGLLLLGSVYWNILREEERPVRPLQPKTQTAKRVPVKDLREGRTASGNLVRNDAANQDAPLSVEVQPLPLDLLKKVTAVNRSERGNIFNYYVPPPPPPQPEVVIPPPPIQLQGLQPNNVYAQTGSFTLKLYGAKFPADAKAFLDGANYPTQLISERELAVEVPKHVIAGAGQRQIQVKSNDAVLTHSNALTLTVTAPPTPPYKYVGLVISGGETVAVILVDNEPKNVHVGDKVEKTGRWVVTAINNQRIEFEDTILRLRHAVPFTGGR